MMHQKSIKRVCAQIIVCVSMVGSAVAAPGGDVGNLHAAISQGYAAVFNAGNLFGASVRGYPWSAAVDRVKQYVAQEGACDVLLERGVAVAERVSRDLVRTWDGISIHVFRYNNRSQQQIEKVRQELRGIICAQSDLRELKEQLRGQRYYSERQRAQVRDVLVALLGHVDKAIEKVCSDFEGALGQKCICMPCKRLQLARK